jgi:membrane-associated phospholipid phosphatase
MIMLRRLYTAAGGLLLLAVNPAQAAPKDWEKASTVARNILVVGAVGLPLVKSDGDGALQAAGSVGAAFLVSEGLKRTFPEMRPDGSDRRSFPSGHTATAFAAAASLQNRQGWQVGIPAQLIAAFVGFARVKGDKHHWYDVVAGAAVGEASGFLITSRYSQDVQVMPWADSKGGGLTIAMRY